MPQRELAAVAEWYRYRIMACLLTSSNPLPPKTCRVGQRCTLNLSRAETSSRGVVGWWHNVNSAKIPNRDDASLARLRSAFHRLNDFISESYSAKIKSWLPYTWPF
ncbi:hypothetical protein TNCV_824521 [Trichonephila clavipes]|nr:hypothetical protein TNCV_824521 [Trichonephila clavipes]